MTPDAQALGALAVCLVFGLAAGAILRFTIALADSERCWTCGRRLDDGTDHSRCRG